MYVGVVVVIVVVVVVVGVTVVGVVVVGVMVVMVVWVGGEGGGGDDDGGDDGRSGDCGGDFGREECFDGLFIWLPLEVGGLPHFQTMWVGTFWLRNAPVLLY